MHGLDLILTLAGAFTAALIFGYLTQRAGLSPIVGYLVAGTLVGPHTPGFVANSEIAEQLAEVGVILLMFGVGLQFHIDELLAVRGVGRAWRNRAKRGGDCLGALMRGGSDGSGRPVSCSGWRSRASTVVLIRVLTDHRDLHTPVGHSPSAGRRPRDLFTVLAGRGVAVLFAPDGAGSNIVVARA